MMRMSITQPATSWPRAVVRFLFLCVFGTILMNTIPAILIYLGYRTSEPYRTLDAWELQQWKTPSKLIITGLLSLHLWLYLFNPT